MTRNFDVTCHIRPNHIRPIALQHMEYFPTTTTTFKPPRTLEGKLVIAQVNIDLGKNMHRKQHLYSHLYHLDFSSSIMLWCVQQQLQQPGGSLFKKYIYIFKYVYVDTFLWVGTRKYNSHTHKFFQKHFFGDKPSNHQHHNSNIIDCFSILNIS